MSSATLTELLRIGARAGASDVHITAEAPPLMRVDGDLVGIPGHPDPLADAWVREAAFGLMNTSQRAEFERHHEVDLAHAAEGIGRFRVNVFRQLGALAMALRFIPDRVFTLEQLGVAQKYPTAFVIGKIAYMIVCSSTASAVGR